MDEGYFSGYYPENYERHVYNCFINSTVSTENNNNHNFTPMDMFPTTLAAMECKTEGNKLGLGTNLFSTEQTLAEKYGIDVLNSELGKSSIYYLSEFVVHDVLAIWRLRNIKHLNYDKHKITFSGTGEYTEMQAAGYARIPYV